MARYFVKNLDSPDDVMDESRLRMQTVDVGDVSVAWIVNQPAARVGDRTWRSMLGSHNERTRELLSRFRGREVNTTGDGFVATFDGAARAIRCAMELARAAQSDGLAIRAAVHTGELELVGDDVRGVAVHEAARMLGLADGSEIVVSALTRELAGAAGIAFEERGEHELRGIDGVRRLYAVTIGR